MADFKCIRKCYHKGVLYKPEDIIHTKGDEIPPRHFIPADQPSPQIHTPKLGTKVGKPKANASMKAPGKADAPKVE